METIIICYIGFRVLFQDFASTAVSSNNTYIGMVENEMEITLICIYIYFFLYRENMGVVKEYTFFSEIEGLGLFWVCFCQDQGAYER